MRLSQLSTLLAVVAIGCCVVLYFRVEHLGDLLSSRAEPRGGIRGSEAVGDSGGGGDAGAALSWQPSETQGADATRHATGGPGDVRGDQAAAPSLEERIARLEQKSRAPHGMPLFSDKYVRTIDDLSKQLSLTSTQRTRIEDAIARGRQRIDDVLKIPDETGKSPFERRAEARKKLEEAMKNPQAGGMLAFATDLLSDRNRKIPGRNDTYADEIGRVRKETREEIATALSPKQLETFEDTNVDGLLGESSQMTLAYSVGSGQGDGAGEMVVEMGANVVEEGADDEESPPAAPGDGGR